MRKKNYINNKTLYEFMIEHHRNLKINKDHRLDDYIVQAIMLICNNLSRKPNFSRYTYKDDMVSDAICDCIAAVNNFNSDKTENPFAYFTQIAWNAFLRRIHKEKRETYIKHKNFEYKFLTDMSLVDNETLQLKNNELSNEVIKSFEATLTKQKACAKVTGIDKFVEGKNEK
jgi:DNA-directed RNA polymerase specialized sigma24 family protein